MEKLITLENVSKSYSGKRIIDSVSFNFLRGESIALSGHNGCGKSTMLKIVAGFTAIDQGSVNYHKKLRFSYVPEKFPGMDVSVNSYLYAVADMEGAGKDRVDGLVYDFFLEGMTDTKMISLSKGSLQKVGVIQALIAHGDVLLLDEPLSGQDAASQEVFISKINELRGKGHAVIMSCHEKKLMDELSDKIYTINKGKLEELKQTQIADTFYKVYVRMAEGAKPWDKMTECGKRYMLKVRREEMKDTIMRLYAEKWELVGIEEFI